MPISPQSFSGIRAMISFSIFFGSSVCETNPILGATLTTCRSTITPSAFLPLSLRITLADFLPMPGSFVRPSMVKGMFLSSFTVWESVISHLVLLPKLRTLLMYLNKVSSSALARDFISGKALKSSGDRELMFLSESWADKITITSNWYMFLYSSGWALPLYFFIRGARSLAQFDFSMAAFVRR